MRKLTAFLVVLVAAAYFLLFPEDHAQELPFDGLTVGTAEDLERALGTREPVPAERPELTSPELLLPLEEERQAVEPEPGAPLLDPLDDLGLADPLPLEDSVPAALPGDAAPAETSGVALSGRVVNTAGQGLPGVRVRVEHPYLPEVLGTSGPTGEFHLTPAEPRGDLVLATTAWVLLGGRRALEADLTEGYLLVVAEPVILRGTVVDPSGQPVEGAQVHGFAPSDALVPFSIAAVPLDHERQHSYTNARGVFQIGPVALMPGTQVEVRKDGYAPVTQGLPEDPRAPLAIVLEAY